MEWLLERGPHSLSHGDFSSWTAAPPPLPAPGPARVRRPSSGPAPPLPRGPTGIVVLGRGANLNSVLIMGWTGWMNYSSQHAPRGEQPMRVFFFHSKHRANPSMRSGLTVFPRFSSFLRARAVFSFCYVAKLAFWTASRLLGRSINCVSVVGY